MGHIACSARSAIFLAWVKPLRRDAVILAIPGLRRRRTPARRHALRGGRRRGADAALARCLAQRPLALATIRQVELDDLLGRDPVELDSAA